jgi:hypothetical protein
MLCCLPQGGCVVANAIGCVIAQNYLGFIQTYWFYFLASFLIVELAVILGWLKL